MTSLPNRIDELVRYSTAVLSESGSPSPAIDAAVLLCHVLDKPRSYLLTWPERTLTDTQMNSFAGLLTRRLSGEPIAYILGEREFWSLPLKVSSATLIPRPDTECLVMQALEKARQISGPILDLGTGTGAIALALASELPDIDVTGVDIQHEACELARANAARLGIPNVTFCQGSWFDAIDEGMKFALIVSNPPYIDADDPHLLRGDVRFEPLSALVAEEQGLADIRTIATAARQYLQPKGWLLFEHGYEQAESVRALFQSLGYQDIYTERDDTGNERVTAGCFLL
ncbi:peptide chain release factor N(5)-glutamine methyltransferase [Vibrio mangrovi]|uniref:Release factor glutamine methyltransferase n=1 Tax=Vibrio mangrovi TaxID=474394 RepID=A0A1Y6IS03_9VIBR|nr:peptide chain release factor N(5)-glutamine methyltransferase [Vibrio mangrovi]MDW6001551.1 peptide chain release factor N(5)-glutamine methyltransferase [Vibrio mangrovi]SMS00425.1 Release factor glutamine methyltransferase [Vibrio mangrovi]